MGMSQRRRDAVPPSDLEIGERWPRAWRSLIERSASPRWDEARREWKLVRMLDEDDPEFSDVCQLCGQPYLRTNFELRNIHTGQSMRIGRECVLHFLILHGASTPAESAELFLEREREWRHAARWAETALQDAASVWSGGRVSERRITSVSVLARVLRPELGPLHRIASQEPPEDMDGRERQSWLAQLDQAKLLFERTLRDALVDVELALIRRGLADLPANRVAERIRLKRLRSAARIGFTRDWRPGLAVLRAAARFGRDERRELAALREGGAFAWRSW